MAQYGKAEYWNERYTRESEPFEWYQDYKGIRECLAPLIGAKTKILVVGCGNSRLSEEILNDKKPKKVVSVDISSVVIEQMEDNYRDEPKLQFATMDVTKLEFQNESFDLIVDKGCLDSLLCSDEADRNADLALSEYFRVLSATGTVVCVSYGNEDSRVPYLTLPKYKWDLQQPVQHLNKPSIQMDVNAEDEQEKAGSEKHYCYVLRKSP